MFEENLVNIRGYFIDEKKRMNKKKSERSSTLQFSVYQRLYFTTDFNPMYNASL